MTTWVIIGAGYTGTRLARRLVADRHQVVVTRRSQDSAAKVAADTGARAAVADIEEPTSLVPVLAPGAIVVDSVPPRGDNAGERNLALACAAAGVKRLVYVGSTGVYPPGRGQLVDESTPTGPLAERGRRRLAAETAILEASAGAGLEAVSLRVAGIYGPGRGVHARLAAGNYRIIGDGSTLVCRVHVDDLVSAIIAAGTAEPMPYRLVNVADDEPMSSRAMGDAVAELMGVEPPPSVDPAEVSASVRAMLGADRRVDNRRLKSLGVELRYPSWRQGVPAAMAEDGLPITEHRLPTGDGPSTENR
jgi:nucleoside-diphosphate-sugar epimerase